MTKIVNDQILILAPSGATVPIGPRTDTEITISDTLAVEIRNLSLFCSMTAAAAPLAVYLRRPGGTDTFLYLSAAVALPAEVIIPINVPLLLGRGDRIYVGHAGAVTVAGTMSARYNGLAIID